MDIINQVKMEPYYNEIFSNSSNPNDNTIGNSYPSNDSHSNSLKRNLDDMMENTDEVNYQGYQIARKDYLPTDSQNIDIGNVHNYPRFEYDPSAPAVYNYSNSSSSVSATANATILSSSDKRLLETVSVNGVDVMTKDLELAFVTAIFELGLKHSSPKILVPFMPQPTNFDLSTEHIKSHLQKYRIHGKRSKEEFEEYYRSQVAQAFYVWSTVREEWRYMDQLLQNQKQQSQQSGSGSDRGTSDAQEGNGARDGLMLSAAAESTNLAVDVGAEAKYNVDDAIVEIGVAAAAASGAVAVKAEVGESGETSEQPIQQSDPELVEKFRRLSKIKATLLDSLSKIDEMKGQAKTTAEDAIRFSKNLTSMINL